MRKIFIFLCLLSFLSNFAQRDISVTNNGNIFVNRSIIPLLENDQIDFEEFDRYLWKGFLPGAVFINDTALNADIRFDYQDNFLEIQFRNTYQKQILVDEISSFEVFFDSDSAKRIFEKVYENIEIPGAYLEVLKPSIQFDILIERVIRVIEGDYNPALGVGEKKMVKRKSNIYLRRNRGELYKIRSKKSIANFFGNKTKEIKSHIASNKLGVGISDIIAIIKFYESI